ncbi:MAG: LemA family protein [Anaerostipes sp.]|jgi:LemA protein|nr:LemA family protein [Anaerostipes sp.]MDD3746158.1 LemA family protein [Anaerostipes sp.]
MGIGIVVVIVIVIALFVVSNYNGLVKLKNNVEEGFATMDVYLKKRFDLIPNLVETVKGYAKHESETLEKVIAARSGVMSASTLEEKVESENILSGTLKSLFAVSEAYPDLKANQNFMDLQNQLKKIEEDIANARKYYNAVVKEFNNKIEMFPSNIIAGIFHFTRKPMFEVNTEEERENVKVQF